MIMQGTARLGMQPTRLWLTTAEHAVLAMLQHYQQPITQPPVPPSSVSTTVVARQQNSRGGLRFVAGVLYALARLGHDASDALLQAATAQLLLTDPPVSPLAHSQGGNTAKVTAAHAHAGAHTAHTAHMQWGLDLAQALWSLAMLGHRPPPEQLDALAEHVLWCVSTEHPLAAGSSSSSSSSATSMGSLEVAQVRLRLHRH